jgi:Flp pilus assembly protein TadD
MYLPLAAVVAVVVTGLAFIAGSGRESNRSARAAIRVARLGPAAALVLGGAAMAALVHGTVRRNQDYQSAIAIWSDTARKNPRNPRAHTQLGTALATAHRGEEAIAEFATAVDLNPDYGPAVGNLTHALEAAGRIGPAEAIQGYSRALELDPSLEWSRVHLGFTLLRTGQPGTAAAHFAEAVRRAPDFAPAHYGLGMARSFEGRMGEARAQFERALALDPGDDAARRALSWIDSAGTSTGASRR